MSRARLAVFGSIALAACSSVNDFPLGGPNGGTTSPTEPNGSESVSNDADVSDAFVRDAPETIQLARGVSGDR